MKNSGADNIFKRFFPAAAVDYCFDLWKSYDFHFKISRKRNSKLGDYRFDPEKGKHIITVNSNLNPYSFLITYIHEVAHLKVQVSYKNKLKPHGQEWKYAFRQIMNPLLINEIFPDNILIPLKKHMKNPKASSTSDHKLMIALSQYDAYNQSNIPLLSLQLSQRFRFRNKTFKILEKKRTRFLVLEEKKQKKYLISGSALVEKL